MKDSVVRGSVLQLLYENREKGPIPLGQMEHAVSPPKGINRGDWLRAVAQLADYGLIVWHAVADDTGRGLLGGFARISDQGRKVIEQGAGAPIGIVFDEDRRASAEESRRAAPAESTAGEGDMSAAVEKVIYAIERAEVSEQEKREAKRWLRGFLESALANKLLGTGARELLMTYFHN